MSNVRDERLHRLFRDGGVKFQRPNIQTEDWFNLFVIHQNHAAHTYTSSIPESFYQISLILYYGVMNMNVFLIQCIIQKPHLMYYKQVHRWLLH